MLAKHWKLPLISLVCCALILPVARSWTNRSDQKPTLLLYPDGTPSGYRLNNAHVYYDSSVILNADANSFKPLAKFYQEGGFDEFARDRDSVFFFSFIIPGADPDTFEVLGSLESCGHKCVYEARDYHKLYYQDQIVGQL